MDLIEVLIQKELLPEFSNQTKLKSKLPGNYRKKNTIKRMH